MGSASVGQQRKAAGCRREGTCSFSFAFITPVTALHSGSSSWFQPLPFLPWHARMLPHCAPSEAKAPTGQLASFSPGLNPSPVGPSCSSCGASILRAGVPLTPGFVSPRFQVLTSPTSFVPLDPVDAASCFLQLLPLLPEIHFCCPFCVWHPYLL